MKNTAWSLWRPLCEQQQRGVCAAGATLLVFLMGCRNDSPDSNGSDAMSRGPVAKYFLVTLHAYDISSMDIYAVEDPTAVNKIGRWIKEHVNSSPSVQKARGLVLLNWHDELLRFDGQGRLIFSDYLCDTDVISAEDRVVLNELFQKYGKRVDTVPGRQPPKQSGKPTEQAMIEKG